MPSRKKKSPARGPKATPETKVPKIPQSLLPTDPAAIMTEVLPEPVPRPIPYSVLEVYRPYFEGRQRYCLMMGGAGSGKSTAAAQKVLWRCLTTPGLRVLVVRKVAAKLRQSCWALLRELLAEHGADRATLRLSEYEIQFDNGAAIVLTGIDDPIKLKSIHAIGSVWVEEATELEAADWAQLELRVRGATPGYRQFTATFNPVDEHHWIKGRFYDTLKGIDPSEVLRLHTTWRDNPHLDDEYRRHMQEAARHSDNDYRVYVLGEWGSGNRYGLFYPQFDERRHLAACPYEPGLPLHLSFDFNVLPYVTCVVWQVHALEGGRTGLWQIAEHCLEPPVNDTLSMARHLLSVYGGHQAPVLFYGDPSGTQRHTTSQLTDFDIISSGLAALGARPGHGLRRAAPRLAWRGVAINALLGQELGGYALRYDPSCVHTLRDLRQVRQEPNGGKSKPRRLNEQGLYCEPLGHCSDAGDYLIMALAGPMLEGQLRRPGSGGLAFPLLGV